MAYKMTRVHIPLTPGYTARGHVTYQEAIDQAKLHYESQLFLAERALAAIRAGNVRVFHQTGIYRVHNRKEVSP